MMCNKRTRLHHSSRVKLSLVRHCLKTAGRAEIADIEQMEKTVPLITWEIALCQYVCELVLGVNVFDLNLRVKIDSIEICSRRIMIWSFSIWRFGFRFWHELSSFSGLSVLVCEKMTELAKNFLHESDKFVSGLLVLLAPESAFPMSSSSSSASHEYEGSESMSSDSSWKIAAEVSEWSKLSRSLGS